MYLVKHTAMSSGYISKGFDGCRGGQDVWGFTWPNAEDEDTVIVTCPDGQGNILSVINNYHCFIVIFLHLRKCRKDMCEWRVANGTSVGV